VGREGGVVVDQRRDLFGVGVVAVGEGVDPLRHLGQRRERDALFEHVFGQDNRFEIDGGHLPN
jgi:hypothetical protein